MQETVQRAQPEGVPPLELTGERTLPDVPAETGQRLRRRPLRLGSLDRLLHGPRQSRS